MALTADEVSIQQTNTYPRDRDRRHYRYQSSFGNHPPIFKIFRRFPWLIGQSNDIYWSKHRRKNRDYTYPNYFGSEAWFKNLSNIPWCMSWFSNKTEYWSKHRRVNRDYTYPSFFMNINTIPSYKWSCETLSEGDVWTCETLDETLSDSIDESGGTDGWGSGWGN